MALKGKRSVTLERDASPIQPHEEDASVRHAPGHDEIRRRAYEIYLERDSHPGDELDDWLRAERELQKAHFVHSRLESPSAEASPGSEDGN